MFGCKTKDTINVLVLDDQDDQIKLQRIFIRRVAPHANILEFQFPDKAKRHYANGGRPLPDVILSDYYMGEINGADMYDFFQSIGFTGRFYFLSSDEDIREDVLKKCPKAKFFTKPFTTEIIRIIMNDCASA